MKNKSECKFETCKTEEQWRKELGNRYEILRSKGTEAPFTGTLLHNKEKGIYICGACKSPIFSSDSKFDSGTGWPSFSEVISNNKIILKNDSSMGMNQTEVLCSRCGSHLGHIFDDGPKPSGKRFCINSDALNFKKMENKEIAVFGAGCFWHVQEEFDKLKEIIKTTVGYMGGNEEEYPNPTYMQVSSDKSGFAEVVQIIFNPEKISYNKLLDIFWKIHNPTSLNKQGDDVGTQYRSVIFYYNKNQRELALDSRQNLQKKYGNKVVTEIIPVKIFFPAEDYHQKYLSKTCLMRLK